MPEMTMHTRRSARNLQQLARPEQINESGNDENCRNYDLNYDRAMRKKLNACNIEYLVTRVEKGENHVLAFRQLCTNYIGQTIRAFSEHEQ